MAEDTKSIKIGIFRLDRVETPVRGEWASMVVAAKDERAAREIANQESKDEGYIWSMPEKAKALLVGSADDGVDGMLAASETPPIDTPWDVSNGCSLFLLERAEIAGADEWTKVVVAARDEVTARKIANQEAAHAAGFDSDGGEDPGTKAGFLWTDGRLTHARKIGSSIMTEETVILGTKDSE